MSSDQTQDIGAGGKLGLGYFNECVDELKKVSHPTRRETIQTTTFAIFIVMFVAVCLFFLDFVFSRLMLSIFSQN